MIWQGLFLLAIGAAVGWIARDIVASDTDGDGDGDDGWWGRYPWGPY